MGNAFLPTLYIASGLVGRKAFLALRFLPIILFCVMVNEKGEYVMSAIAFNTLAYAKKLKAAGFTEQQAEVQAEAMAELVNEQLATKRDLKELEMSLVLRLGSIMVAGIAVIATLVKIL